MVPKLFQWLLACSAYIALWIGLIQRYYNPDVNDSTQCLILYLPFITIGAFGIYSIFVIGYRVATFNDCLEAATELKSEIQEAKKDLTTRGYKFD